MDRESKASFAIIRFNSRSYESGGVMEIVRGRQSANLAIQRLHESQSKEDWALGWRYFAEMTDLKPGTDPAKATRLRQGSMDARESES
jgi:hypothetical protein